jgi:hypothetical protein
MDLGSRDYSLNFRGFEHNDPERVQRFKAFCEANFSLSPDKAHSILSSSATTVLTHSGSLEELEALAKVLREIGALVDVSEPDAELSFGSPHLPSTQDLHRLFAREREQTLQDIENIDTIEPDTHVSPNPKQRSTLYLLTADIDIAAQRKALRDKASIKTVQQSSPRPHAKGRRPALALSLTGCVVVGVSALFALSRFSPNVVDAPPVFGIAHRHTTQGTPLLTNAEPARNLSGSTKVRGVSIEAKILIGPKSLSLSSLAIATNSSDRGAQSFIQSISDNAIFRRAEGEPAFLSENERGVWTGDVTVSLFTDTNGEIARQSRTYQATVRLNGERSGSLELRDTNTGENIVTVPLASTN